jgi:SAM-dependent methyltransferase
LDVKQSEGVIAMSDEPLSDTWEKGDSYERYVGRWSRRVAPIFLNWLNASPGQRWLDVGCGTGALCAAILEHGSPASVTGVEPSEGFLETAKKTLSSQAVFYTGDATAIPLQDASVDVVVSGLVLNFVPDAPAALKEMIRVAADQGIIGAYVWDYAGKMELMRYFWDAAISLDHEASKLDEGSRFPLCRPDGLKNLFTRAGLNTIDVMPIDIPTPFENFDDYWKPFLGGQGPAPVYAMSLSEPARVRFREAIKERLPIQSDGSISLIARAWAIRSTVAG